MARLPRSTKTHTRAVSSRTVTWRPITGHQLRKSFKFAFAGISRAWRNEPNFRIEVSLGVAASLMAFWLQVSPVSIWLISALVLSLELLNSALEATVDLISSDFHPLAKLAKDAAAGAVLLSSILAVLIGLVVLGPPLLAKIGLLQ